ncbi:MAG: septal ring lytic transglycosylase RlpA family protein [Bacteroidales bacterium]|nr:septal ring lytic transglycosylase RlpA family protein [Bacteroidales bacterium]MBN2758399.1 septal ring lytic transglycosylase RlpA family protein [Bacteroidales bacterium]
MSKIFIVLLIFYIVFINIGCNISNTKKQKELHIEKGIASWYGKEFNGKPTASGEVFNMNKLTAAHKNLEFGTLVKVKNLKTNETVIVKINDRGPYSKNRIIDLSKKAAKKIKILNSGIGNVSISIYGYENNNLSAIIKHYRNLQIIKYGKIIF